MTNTDNNGENNENDHPPMTLEELNAEIQRLSNVETALINVRQEANDAAEEIHARRLNLGQLRQRYLNNQSAQTPQRLNIQNAAAINGNLGQEGQQENDGSSKEAQSSSNSTTADGNALGAGPSQQHDDPSTSLPQPLAQRNDNSGKIQQLASAPPILSCNQQHHQQQQQQEQVIQIDDEEEEMEQENAMAIQPLSQPNFEVIQIDDEEEELEQENAMEMDGSADVAQNETNENVEQCQEELQDGIDEEARRRNLAEWRRILDNYFNEFAANTQNEVIPEANINVENEDQPMDEGGQEPTAAENNQSRIEELEPPQNDQIQQMNAEEDVQDEEEIEHHCECDDGRFNQQPEEEEDEPANENEIGGANVGGNHQGMNGKRLKRRYTGEPWCLGCLFHQQFGWYPREEYDNDPELKKRFAKYIRQRTMIREEDEELKEEFEQFLRQYLNHREMNGDEPFPQQKRATRGRSRSRGRNQQPNDGALENDGGASNVQSTSNGNNNANIAQGSPPTADANSRLNSSDDAYGNDRKKLNANRNIQKKALEANPPNGPSTSTTFDEMLANMGEMPSTSTGSQINISANYNGPTLCEILPNLLRDSQPHQIYLASITEAILDEYQEQYSINEQMTANAPNSNVIQQNGEMTRKKAKPSPISTVNGKQNSQPQQSATSQQQRKPVEQGIWMTSTSNFTPPSNMADDVFEFPSTSPPHDGNGPLPTAVGNGQRRSDSPRKGGGEKRAKKADKPVAGSAVLNPKYERIGGSAPRNMGNNGHHQDGTTNVGNVGQQSEAQHSPADGIFSKIAPQRPATVHRQRSMNGQANEGQIYQSTPLNIGINANPVQRRDPGPALRDQNLIVSAMNNPKGQLAKTMGDPGAIRSLLAKPHSHKNTENANGKRRPETSTPNQRLNVANNGQMRLSTSTRPSNPPSMRGQQLQPVAGASSIRQHQQKCPRDQRGTGGTKKLRFLFGTVTPADVGATDEQSAGKKANGPRPNGGNVPSNGQGTSTGNGNAVHGPTNQGGNEAKKGAEVAKSGQKPAPPPANDLVIPKSKFAERSKPSAGGSRR